MTTTTEAAENAVTRGANFLDREVGEDWHVEVDLPSLEIASLRGCILGQVFGHFSDGVEELGIDGDVETQSWLGFDGGEADTDELTKAWRNEILSRRS